MNNLTSSGGCVIPLITGLHCSVSGSQEILSVLSTTRLYPELKSAMPRPLSTQ